MEPNLKIFLQLPLLSKCLRKSTETVTRTSLTLPPVTRAKLPNRRIPRICPVYLKVPLSTKSVSLRCTSYAEVEEKYLGLFE